MGRHSARPPADDQPTQRLEVTSSASGFQRAQWVPADGYTPAPPPAAAPPPAVASVPLSTFGTGLTIRQRKLRDNTRDAIIVLAVLAAGLLGIWFVVLGMTP